MMAITFFTYVLNSICSLSDFDFTSGKNKKNTELDTKKKI